ncbi:TPA: hypothetical protein ACH3X1_004410 [Trebouxia sp. C0004]
MSDAPSLQTGTVLCSGRYHVQKEINRGGSAVVYHGLDRIQSRAVALKVMHAHNGILELPVKAFQREVYYAAGVLHDNIVQLLDVFVEGEQYVIVWELVNGPDLLDLLNAAPDKKLPEPMVAYYFQQLINAVIFMHNHGFCHRDLKAENCVVDSSTQRVKVIDFGLSKHLESAMTLGIGTPDYMAPELLLEGHLDVKSNRQAQSGQSRQPRYNPRAVDVWALGVMLYLLVTGMYPFEDSSRPGNVTATLRNIMHGKMQSIPAFVSPACAEVIKKALSRHPKMRITLDELASNAWVRTKAAEYERQLVSGSAARSPFVSRLPAIYGSHADMTAQSTCTGQHANGCSA